MDGGWLEPNHREQAHALFPFFPGDVHGGGHGAKLAAATSLVAQLSHSPACRGWTCCTSSGCHAGAAPAPVIFSSFFSPIQASLGTLGALLAIL